MSKLGFVGEEGHSGCKSRNTLKGNVLCQIWFKVIPQKWKLPMNFFETFPECSLPRTVSKNTMKMMPVLVLITSVIYRLTLHFAVARNIVHKSNTREKNLTGRKCRAYRTIWYKICGKITLFKTTWTWSVRKVVILAGHNLHHRVTVSCTLPLISFFPSDKIC